MDLELPKVPSPQELLQLAYLALPGNSHSPGLPILHLTQLIQWKQLLPDPPQSMLQQAHEALWQRLANNLVESIRGHLCPMTR